MEAKFHSHLDFYLPPSGATNLKALRFPPDLLRIFYIARVVFSESSRHRIRSQVAPLFNREQVFSSGTDKAEQETTLRQKVRMDNFINLDKIRSIGDIARLLPREHVIYAENIFYKKLANRELIKIDYEGNTAAIRSVDTFLKRQEHELQRSQKVYLLFDNSTSMNGERFKKLYACKAVAIEYLRSVMGERPQLYFRTFHSEIGELVKAGSEEEIHKLINYITRLQTGGGRVTIIGDAVQQAIDDIMSDPEMREAEILVMTDGFGPIPSDLNERLGHIKPHVLLIPDLDIEKILQLYPTRDAWERGGPNGTRPMPEFWKYYSDKAPPASLLQSDELHQKAFRSYSTASKSVKEIKMLEILEGLSQIYALQTFCSNFIFVLITALFGEKFLFTQEELAGIAAYIAELEQKSIDDMTNNEKLQFLQAINFLIQFLAIARCNAADKAVKQRIKELEKSLEKLQAHILEDPWIKSILKADKVKISVKFDMAVEETGEQMPFWKALAFFVKFMWQQLREYWQQLRMDYKFS